MIPGRPPSATILGGTTSIQVKEGDNFEIVPTSSKFKANTKINVGSQQLSIDISCSVPLRVGDIFGSLTLVGFKNGEENSPECAFCVNDVPKDSQDEGCFAFKPICEAEPEKGGQACFKCIDDKFGGFTDTACMDGCGLCIRDTPVSQFGSICKLCSDDRVGGAQDPGCPAELPLCVPISDMVSFGDKCAVCLSNSDSTNVDDGCSPETPVCKADKDFY